MKKNQIILIIIILILIGISSALSYWLGKRNVQVEFPAPSPLGFISSKVITDRAITAAGEVKTISGRNLTLFAEGDSLSVIIVDNAQIEKGKGSPLKVNFGDIKVGDKIAVDLELKTDGTFEGKFITIISSK